MSGEKETTEPQALVAAETPQDQFERLRKVLDEVQTNQAEHAAHLDRLEHRTDALRANSAANRLLTSKNAEQLNALAQEAKELRSNAAQAEREIDRLTAQTKTAAEELWAQIERIDDKIIKVLSTAIGAMRYRRMVGNLFRRVADLVDGG